MQFQGPYFPHLVKQADSIPILRVAGRKSRIIVMVAYPRLPDEASLNGYQVGYRTEAGMPIAFNSTLWIARRQYPPAGTAAKKQLGTIVVLKCLGSKHPTSKACANLGRRNLNWEWMRNSPFEAYDSALRPL